MIYLVTAHDRMKRISNIDTPEKFNTHFWKSVLNLTAHRAVLYTQDLFNTLNKQALPNRINIVFTARRRGNILPNVLTNDNFREIVGTFGKSNDDLYVIASNVKMVERFAKHADYIIDYTTEELGHTSQIIFDSINFADYNLLKKKVTNHYDIRYFVREETNFIGY